MIQGLGVTIGSIPFAFNFEEEWLRKVALERYGAFCDVASCNENSRYGVTVNGKEAPPANAIQLNIYDSRLFIAPDRSLMQSVTRDFEFDSLFRMLLAVRLNRAGVLLHASTVVDDGKAHVFMGRSGAGKSTVVELSSSRVAFTDDLSLLRVEEGRAFAYSTPFWGKYRLKTINSRAPLVGVYDLVQSKENRKELLDGNAAVRAVARNAFLFHRDRLGLEAFLHATERLVAQVPIYRLCFRRESAFWEIIS